MRERAPWKVTTFLALGVATAGWFAHRDRAPIASPAHEAGEDRVEPSDRASGVRTHDRSVTLHDGLAELSARLAHAVTPSDACHAFTELSQHGGERATQVIAEGTRARHDVRSRRCGIDALVTLGSPNALAALSTFVDSDDPAVLNAVFTGLARSGVTDAITLVESTAESGEPAPRHAALVALGNAGIREAATSIADALALARTKTQRSELLRALGATGETAMVAVVMHYAVDPDPTMREVAYGALGDLDSAEAVAALTHTLLTGGGRDARAAAQALTRSRTPEARQTLLASAQGAGAVALIAANALVGADGDDVRAVMTSILNSRNPQVAMAGIEHLVARRDLDGVPRLLALADHPNSDVAGRAVSALGELGGDAARAALESLAARSGDRQLSALDQLLTMPASHDHAVASLIAFARDEPGEPSSMAIGLLARDPSPEARRALIEFAQRDDRTASGAIAALGERRDDESLRVLEQIARGTDDTNSTLRAAALDQIAARGGAGTEAERFVLEQANASEPERRAQALLSVGSMQTPAAMRTLYEAVLSPDSAEVVREQSLYALGRSRGPRDLEATNRLLSSSVPSVAASALTTLAEIAPARAAEEIEQRARSTDSNIRESAISSAARLPLSTAQPLLLEALHDPDQSIAITATTQLATLGTREAAEALVAVLNDSGSSRALRRVAAYRLAQMGDEYSAENADLIVTALQAEIEE